MQQVLVRSNLSKRVGLFITSSDPGGAETLVMHMARLMPEYDLDPTIIVLENDWLSQQCKKQNLPILQAPDIEFFRSSIMLPKFSFRLRRFLQLNNIDILHSHLTGAISAGALATFGTRIRHIGTLHDVYSLDEGSNRFFLKLSGFLGTQIITVSSHMTNELLKRLGIFGKFCRPKLIRNGIPEPTPFSSRKSTDSQSTTLISVARLVPLKGHKTLFEAISKSKNSANLRLLVVGDGPYRSDLELFVDKLGIGEQILFLGHKENVIDLLMSSDIFINSSYTEGLSLSISEALMVGLPVIATAVGGTPELVQHNSTGLLVEPDNPDQLASRIDELVNDVEKRQTLGCAAARFARAELNIRSMMEKYVEEYNR